MSEREQIAETGDVMSLPVFKGAGTDDVLVSRTDVVGLLARIRSAAPTECEVCRGDNVKGSKAEICGWHYQKALELEFAAPTEALKALVQQAIELLKHVHVLDCGAHYCRYCPAKSPAWEHAPHCPYEESQKHNYEARELRAKLSAALSTPSAGWQEQLVEKVRALQEYSKLAAWEDVDEPLGELLDFELPAPPAGPATTTAEEK